MKKIINGKKYDTDTAERIGYWENIPDVRDFSQYSEDLYRKKTGEFFLHGEGGPMTKYARSRGQNEWSGGEEIIPLSYESARKWAEEKLDADDYEKVFGEVAEDESRKAVTLSLAADTAETLRREAAKKGVSMSALVEELIKTMK